MQDLVYEEDRWLIPVHVKWVIKEIIVKLKWILVWIIPVYMELQYEHHQPLANVNVRRPIMENFVKLILAKEIHV